MENPRTCLLLITVKIPEQFLSRVRMKWINLEGCWWGVNALQLFTEIRILVSFLTQYISLWELSASLTTITTTDHLLLIMTATIINCDIFAKREKKYLNIKSMYDVFIHGWIKRGEGFVAQFTNKSETLECNTLRKWWVVITVSDCLVSNFTTTTKLIKVNNYFTHIDLLY